MTDTTKTTAVTPPASTPSMVTVEAVKTEREWIHRGKKMQPGDKAEVPLAKAAKLEKAGVAKFVK